ncbi:choice-of-anchor Q domain-containing protein [Algibacter sp. L3A6]|nr:choice-of-anchor Q domain-containing protein [Algibacter sp. L3A6]
MGANSEAINQANSTFAAQVPTDILGVSRTTSADIGAYQHITFPEEE